MIIETVTYFIFGNKHDLVQLSMQQLLECIGSGNGGTGVPSVIGGKRKSDEDDSLASSKKARDRTMMTRHLHS